AAPGLKLVTTALAVAAPCAIAVWLCSRPDALTRQDALLSDATRQGHRLGGWLLLLAAGSALCVVALALAERFVRLPARAGIAFWATVAAAILVAAAGAVIAYGGPA